ncbi:MAG TPA: hypothetical protein VHG08_15065 [Longimicrobium sp.]|nr:hypothetical protein [Longimicrobium sp.]
MSTRSLLLAMGSAMLLAGCGGGEDAAAAKQIRDADRRQYEADKARCDSVSGGVEAAQKSCMTYRGWPDGKFRR